MFPLLVAATWRRGHMFLENIVPITTPVVALPVAVGVYVVILVIPVVHIQIFLLFLVEVVVVLGYFDQMGLLLFMDVVVVLRDLNDFGVEDGFDFGRDVNPVVDAEMGWLRALTDWKLYLLMTGIGEAFV